MNRTSSRIGWIAAALAAVCLPLISAQAQPSISSVQGDFKKGATVVIRGSNFGTKSPVLPKLYFPFGDGVQGAHPELSRERYAGKINGTVGVRSDRAPNSSHVLSLDYNSASDRFLGPGDISLGALNKAYVFWRHRYTFPKRGGNDTFNFKTFRMWSSTSKNNVYVGLDAIITEYTGSENYEYGLDSLGWRDNTWLTDEAQYKASGLGVRDGELWYTRNGRRANQQRYVFRNSTESGMYTHLSMGIFHREKQPGDIGLLDVVYIDDTWARVMVTDKSTWSNSATSINEVQIPVAWSNNEISFVARPGMLPSSGAAYVYVFNADGSVNQQGYRIGCDNCGGGGAADVRPNPPVLQTAR